MTEDILELVNAQIVELTVADRHIAKAWASVLPDIIIHEDIVINSGGTIAMAVRKENQQLLDSLNAFIKKKKIPGGRRPWIGPVGSGRTFTPPRFISARNGLS